VDRAAERTIGVAASLSANVSHVEPGLLSKAWLAIALLLAIELIARVPIDRR
jgi:hypothetical protein